MKILLFFYSVSIIFFLLTRIRKMEGRKNTRFKKFCGFCQKTFPFDPIKEIYLKTEYNKNTDV
jgi:hypothetical protein